MTNKITYGPHLFRGHPAIYIRSNNNLEYLHSEMINSIKQAFDKNKKHSLTNQIKKKYNVNINDEINISFINHGDTELVYQVKFGNDTTHALLINQPEKEEIVLNEFKNLRRLYNNDSRFVVEPIAFFKNNNHFMYLSEYFKNPLCIANSKNNNVLGIYNPKPEYHFSPFNKRTSNYVNISRIAHLINAYDEKRNLGISKTQISGNDFILNSHTNLDNLQSIIHNTKLIAARDTIQTSLEHYISLIKEEFQIATHRDMSQNMKINTHSRMSIELKIIEQGIEHGLILRREK